MAKGRRAGNFLDPVYPAGRRVIDDVIGAGFEQTVGLLRRAGQRNNSLGALELRELHASDADCAGSRRNGHGRAKPDPALNHRVKRVTEGPRDRDGFLVRQGLGRLQQPVLGKGNVLSVGPGGGVTGVVDPGAEVALAAVTEIALAAAGGARQDDAITDRQRAHLFAGGDDLAGHLATRQYRELDRPASRQLGRAALTYASIPTVDCEYPDAHQDILRPVFRQRHGIGLEHVGPAISV
jgi:hypothetical protein